MTRLAFTCAVGVALIAGGCALLYPVRKDETTSSPAGAGGSASGGSTGAGGSGVEAGRDAGAECHNRQCSDDNAEAPFICRRGCIVTETEDCCIRLKTDDCPVVYPDAWRDDNAIVFGAYGRLDPGDFMGRSDEIVNYKMALDELKTLAVPDSTKTIHPLVAVICNNDPAVAARRPDFYESTLDHLVQTVGVNAIVANLPTPVLLDDFKRAQEMHKKNVFFLGTGAANQELVTYEADHGRIWNLIGTPHDLVAGYQWLVSRIEAYARKTDATLTAVRVAMVTSPNLMLPDLEELRAALRSELVFNDLSLERNMTNALYQEFNVPPGTTNFMPLANQVLAFDPHIVISMLGRDFTLFDPTTQKRGVLASMTFLDPDLTYPFYVLSPINKAAVVEDVVPQLRGLANAPTTTRETLFLQRVLGINSADTEDRELLLDYQTQLGLYSRQTIGRPAGTGAGSAYDAIYYLAYAIGITGIEKPYDGIQLAAGMGRLTYGERHKVGRNDIMGVLDALSQDAIALTGVSGSHFDANKGVRISSSSLYCFGGMPGINSERPLYDPGEIYDPIAKTHTTIHRCGPESDF